MSLLSPERPEWRPSQLKQDLESLSSESPKFVPDSSGKKKKERK